MLSVQMGHYQPLPISSPASWNPIDLFRTLSNICDVVFCDNN